MWAIATISIGVIVTVYYADLYEYVHIRALTVLETISIDATFINFMIMALILVRSSYVATLNQ